MKRILLSLVTVALVASVAIGATRAYFSDEVNSPDNNFATGTMTLEVNQQHPTATAVFDESGLKPGDVISERTFIVHNTGSINGDHLDLTVNLSGDTDLAKYIVFSGNTDGLRFGSAKAGTSSVRFDVPGWTAGDAEYRVRNGLDGSQITGPNANTVDDPTLITGPGNGMDRDAIGNNVTLADLAVGKVRIAPNAVNDGIAAGTTATLWMNAKVDPAMGNDMQGKTLHAEFVWTLHQDASQF